MGSPLEIIQEALAAVTQQAPDHETLMLAQATRTLYKPLLMKLPLPVITELSRRLLKGYTTFKQEPKAVQLTKAIDDCNQKIRSLGIRNHQVEWGNIRRRPWWLVLGILLYRVGEFVTLSVETLPSLALFCPIFAITKIISVRKHLRRQNRGP